MASGKEEYYIVLLQPLFLFGTGWYEVTGYKGS